MRTIHLGEFWSRIKDQYPTTEDHAPLPSLFDPTTGVIAGSEIWDPTMPPLRRLFCIDPTGNFVLQVGAARFLANWRRSSTTDVYPRFEAAYERFTKGLSRFTDFAESADLGGLRINQFELSYINHIPEAISLGESGNQSLFAFYTPHQLKFDLCEDKVFDIAARFRTPLKNIPASLHVTLQQGIKVDGEATFVLDLTVRGPATNNTKSEDWFRTAHDAIVSSFVALTSPAAHKIWGRVQ